MTANRTQNAALDQQLILELRIDASGEVTRKPTKLGRKDTLEGKLLGQLYPGIRVARVSVPYELTPYEQSVVENRMASLHYGGVEYKLVGASGSAKDGKFYFVDKAHAGQIAERFQHWPEAAIVYFAILVSDCKLMVEEPDLRIAVVKDHVLGTNDCRGWVRESLYRKLKIGTNRFCQFRLAFDTREPKQAKGALKAMSDRVADKLAVDVILPESACKPALKGGVRFLPQLGTSGRMFTGPAILGIKQISRQSEFGSSYTLIEHASEEALQFELKLWALQRIKTMRKAWDEGDYQALFEVIGKSEVTTIDDGVNFDPDSLEREDDQASEGCDPAEAVLLADRSGNAIKIPYVFNQLNRKLARWAFRACTSADLKLPSFALADDGVLIEHRGKILSASDWIPEDSSITSLTAEQGLCVRYPIRMQEDLLPIRHLTNEELVPALKQALGTADLDDSLAATILERQLRMEGTYILHSKTASKNGGDFDFDTICVMPSDRFPKFIAGRIAYGQKFQQEKTKHQKAKSPWWNACPVAMKARGNRIGSITDLKTSCLAAGRQDLAYKLVEQLQNALDSLKHRVEIDESVVSEIRKEVAPAPWLRYKRERRVSELPAHLEVADTDKVGRLYNLLRKELGFLPDETGNGFEEKMEIEDFRGLFSGEHVTREMFEECQLVNSIYGDIASRIVQREDEVKQQLKDAQAQWETVRKSEDKEQRRSAVLARNKAQAALWEHEQDARDQFSSLHLFIHYWAQGKQENRRAWAQAMNAVVTGGTGSGAVLFQSFPQEVVDAFAAVTGGERVRVRMPKTVNGYAWFDDERRAFLVERIANPEGPECEKRVFLFQYRGKRNLLFENTSAPIPLGHSSPAKEKREPLAQLLLSVFWTIFASREAAMKTLTTISLALAVATAGAQTTSQSQIRHIETSLNHLTVLELGESVTMLAIADPDSFEIERHDDKVFVKPLREGVSTNLFVWTASRELSYELDPAGQLAAMDVLVRTEPAPKQHVNAQASAEPSDAEIRKIASLVLTQTMMGVENITREPQKLASDRVDVDVEQVYRAKDRLYIRYSIANRTRTPFRVTDPDVCAPFPSEQPISLVSLKNHQINSQTFMAFKARKVSGTPVIQAESGARDLAPGEKTTGVISIESSAGNPPQIYQLNFGADQSGPLKVEVVL